MPRQKLKRKKKSQYKKKRGRKAKGGLAKASLETRQRVAAMGGKASHAKGLQTNWFDGDSGRRAASIRWAKYRERKALEEDGLSCNSG